MRLDPLNNRPLFIVGIVIAILAFLSIFKIGGSVGPVQIKRIDLFSDVLPNKKDCKRSINNDLAAKNGTSPAGVHEVRETGQNERTAAPDTLTISFAGGQSGSLDSFFEELRRTERDGGKVRIAYFGDSIIEGDLITHDLRKNLQRSFGGSGVGFVPVTSATAAARGTIHHRFSDNWQVLALHPRPKNEAKLGISGFTFLPRSDQAVTGSVGGLKTERFKHSWTEYTASALSENTHPFRVVKLYYGPSNEPAFAKYTLDGEAEHTIDLCGDGAVQEAVISNNGPVNKVRIDFFARGQAPVYGLSFEDTRGVYVDNFAIRGYSGLTLDRIPGQIYSGFDRFLRYRLIIVHYGINVAGFTTKQEFNWYRKQMTAVLGHLKNAFPGASFLVISVNDIGHRDNMETVTKPSIPLLVEAQYNIARETGAAFWNLFNAMGGENSMADWAAGQRPLASKDLTHFNPRGAKKIADLLTKALLEEYEAFKARREHAGSSKTSPAKNIRAAR